MSEPKKKIGPYHVEGEIGRGSMGVVYRARHELTRKDVALKVVFENVVQSFSGAERFRREVSVSALVDDPGIVEVFDAGEFEGSLFYAMELLEGEDLEKVMETRELDEVVAILADVATTAARCHEAGIIHRDLKPENIYVREIDGERLTKVLDFGIASVQSSPTATQTGFALGTPAYMSPEQAMAPKKAGGASDVWSIGVMLYEACSGELPFEDEAPAAVLMKVVNQDYPPLSDEVSGSLVAIIGRCLQKSPADRYANAGELAADLRAYLAGDEVAAALVAKQKSATAGMDDESGLAAASDEEFIEPTGTGGTRKLAAFAVALSVLLLVGWFVGTEFFEREGDVVQTDEPDETATAIAATEDPAEGAASPEAETRDDTVRSAIAFAEAFTVVEIGLNEAVDESDELEARQGLKVDRQVERRAAPSGQASKGLQNEPAPEDSNAADDGDDNSVAGTPGEGADGTMGSAEAAEESPDSAERVADDGVNELSLGRSKAKTTEKSKTPDEVQSEQNGEVNEKNVKGKETDTGEAEEKKAEENEPAKTKPKKTKPEPDFFSF